MFVVSVFPATPCENGSQKYFRHCMCGSFPNHFSAFDAMVSQYDFRATVDFEYSPVALGFASVFLELLPRAKVSPAPVFMAGRMRECSRT
jgi:hypothetical protein